MNEESVGNVMAYFNELREQKSQRENVAISTNLGHNQAQGHVINVTGANAPASNLETGYLSFN